MNKSPIILAATAAFLSLEAYAAPSHLVVHEWGTFTSVQGSDGAVLGGLQHEEELLPPFVHSRDPLKEAARLSTEARTLAFPHGCRIKGMECDLAQTVLPSVTQKMETPVLYFHSPEQLRVKVDVAFPQGIVSQYYPGAVDFSPPVGSVRNLTGGSASFSVEVMPKSAAPLIVPEVSPASIYAPAREVNASFIRSGPENEKFIFYRGIGDFTTSFEATSLNGSLTLRNRSAIEAMPAAFLVHVTKDGGSIEPLGAIESHSTLHVSAERIRRLRNASIPMDAFLSKADQLLSRALAATGLYRDEALAMTHTWEKSYFRTPGLRVLYILAREETDRILPIQIDPQPKELVRTLVGRVEILLDTEEKALLEAVRSQPDGLELSRSLGRFGEAKLLRIQKLANRAAERQRIQSLLTQIAD